MANLQSLPERTAQIEQKRRDKLEAERARLREKELDGATFRPRIHSTHATSRVMSPNKVQERREALAQRIQAQREAEERENHTFSPSLNPRSLAMAPRGKALVAAASPVRPAVTKSHLDAGHEQETFQPAINAYSRRLAAAKTKSVYERLYQDRPRPPPPVEEKSTPSKPPRSLVHTNTVVFRPELQFMLDTLSRDA